MIQCPSCGKDIADDSAHCGYCGAQVETGSGKKTMIGFAVTPEAIQKAAEEARQARAGAPPEPTGLAEPSESKLKLPRPPISQATEAAPSAPPLGKLSIPRPGGGDAPADDAKTAVMPSVPGPGSAVTAPEALVEDMPGDTVPDDMGGPAGLSEDTMKEITPPDGKTGPSEFGGMSARPSGPSEFGAAAPMQYGQNTLPEKKKTNPAMLIGGVIAILLLFCCVFSVIWNFVLPIILA